MALWTLLIWLAICAVSGRLPATTRYTATSAAQTWPLIHGIDQGHTTPGSQYKSHTGTLVH